MELNVTEAKYLVGLIEETEADCNDDFPEGLLEKLQLFIENDEHNEFLMDIGIEIPDLPFNFDDLTED